VKTSNHKTHLFFFDFLLCFGGGLWLTVRDLLLLRCLSEVWLFRLKFQQNVLTFPPKLTNHNSATSPNMYCHIKAHETSCLMKPPPQRGEPLLWCLSLLVRVGEPWRDRECGELGLLLPPPGVLLPDWAPVPPVPLPEPPRAFIRASW